MTLFQQVLMNEMATVQLGAQLAQSIQAPCVIYLSGPLGAGKSVLVRSMLQALGIQGPIKSPTYALVESYKYSSYSVYHFDFYRFSGENEWEECGFRDYFNENSLCFIEWAEKAVAQLPTADLEISLNYLDNPLKNNDYIGRRISIQAKTQCGAVLLCNLKEI